jgi:hypothetical protein
VSALPAALSLVAICLHRGAQHHQRNLLDGGNRAAFSVSSDSGSAGGRQDLVLQLSQPESAAGLPERTTDEHA